MRERRDGPVIAGATGAGRRSTSEVMSGRLARPAAVLRQEGLLERRLATHEVEQVVVGRLADDGSDRARDAQSEDVVLGRDVADAGQPGEGADGHVAGEPQLGLVMSKVEEGLVAR